jgi:5-methylcytosine-specific restriction protein A
MEQQFLNVFNNFFSTRIRLQGRATVVGTPDQNAVLSEIPNKIEGFLKSRGLAHLFKVKGSIGNGNIARVPWVGVFRKDITENAENGYYIVLLFSENMSCCYLSLNQGITAVENTYTKSFAARKMREAASRALTYLECNPEAYLGTIDLASTGDLGRAYEAAAIVSFKYLAAQPPSDQVFFDHFSQLLEYYESLYRSFGNSLNSLFSVSEGEFQQVVLEKAAVPFKSTQSNHDVVAENAAGTVVFGSKGFYRSPYIAAEAIKAANFACEVDAEHWTFTSRAKKQRYVEAHHLIPISQQPRFVASLDVVENIVSLCATCHRMLHFGVEREKKALLVTLFKGRKQKLSYKSIEVKVDEFLRFYAGSVIIED